MLFDWFTVGAQTINFLVLVWLMKRFLYKPILDAIDAREKRIALELADADAKKADAMKERDEFQQKNEVFDQQRAALLDKAIEEARIERQRLLDEARQAADALASKRQEALRSEQQSLSEALSHRACDEVFAIARQALGDLATTSLEERIGEVFTRRLREMDTKATAALGEALKTASEPVLVRSAFDLPADQRAAIQNAINETFSADIPLHFAIAPEVVCGIELSANGQKLGWNIADYLASLEAGVDVLLKGKNRVEHPSELARQIGKRAYALYEQQGRKEGGAIQDWNEAESEIREENISHAKTNLPPEAKAVPKAEEPKPEIGSP